MKAISNGIKVYGINKREKKGKYRNGMLYIDEE
jgi:hypothetical protein